MPLCRSQSAVMHPIIKSLCPLSLYPAKQRRKKQKKKPKNYNKKNPTDSFAKVVPRLLVDPLRSRSWRHISDIVKTQPPGISPCKVHLPHPPGDRRIVWQGFHVTLVSNQPRWSTLPNYIPSICTSASYYNTTSHQSDQRWDTPPSPTNFKK